MMNSNKLSVVKIGGSTIDDWHKSIGQVNEIISMGNSLVIVHGGGKTVSDWGSKLGIRPEFVKGLRKTDSKTLEVAIAILSGLVNSKLVSFLNKNGFKGMKVTIVSSEINEKLALSSRNVPYVSMVKASSCSVRDLYDNDVIIIDISGLEVLSSRFGDKN